MRSDLSWNLLEILLVFKWENDLASARVHSSHCLTLPQLKAGGSLTSHLTMGSMLAGRARRLETGTPASPSQQFSWK